jgi:hypothetical protein
MQNTWLSYPIEEQHGLGRHFATLRPGEYVHMLKVSNVRVRKSHCAKHAPAVLGQRNCLQYWSNPRQSLHIAPISTILCWYNRQAHMLGSARYRRCIRIVDLLGQHLRLHADCILLGKEYTWRPLSQFAGFLVLECFVQYCYRFHNLHLTNTGTQGSSITKEAEIHSDRCLCAGWIVSWGSLLFWRTNLANFCSGCITSILRLHSLYIISRSDDVTWDNVGAATWSSVELNVGIMCACLPPLKPLMNRLFPHALLSTQRITVDSRQENHVRLSAGRDTDGDLKGQDHDRSYTSMSTDLQDSKQKSVQTTVEMQHV